MANKEKALAKLEKRIRREKEERITNFVEIRRKTLGLQKRKPELPPFQNINLFR
jgi:hypothetical protein